MGGSLRSARWRLYPIVSAPSQPSMAQIRDHMPNSPQLEAAKTKAQFLIAIAENDDMQLPTIRPC